MLLNSTAQFLGLVFFFFFLLFFIYVCKNVATLLLSKMVLTNNHAQYSTFPLKLLLEGIQY